MTFTLVDDGTLDTVLKCEMQAEQFLKRYNLTLSIRRKAYRCPPWDDASCAHGDHYGVTIASAPARRGRNPEYPGAMSVSFSFWNSLRDKADGKSPSAYDILACVASDAHSPTDPDEVAAEFGDIKPSVVRYMVERNFVQVIGMIWQPMAGQCAMEYTLSPHDVASMGDFTRDTVQRWLDTHAGDFQSIDDFRASVGNDEIEWASEESELTYNDCTFGSEM